jgi:hypothetical protein
MKGAHPHSNEVVAMEVVGQSNVQEGLGIHQSEGEACHNAGPRQNVLAANILLNKYIQNIYIYKKKFK